MGMPTEGPTTPQPSEASLPAPSRDAAYWAEPVSTLRVGGLPAGAVNLNVTGRRVVGPLQGFGQMWQKTYRVSLRSAAVTPAEVISTWKAQFPSFWPEGNRFYGPLTGIAPGEVAILDLTMAGGMRLSTGVLVLYADDESFTLMTPQGHMFAGWITFSAYAEEPDSAAEQHADASPARYTMAQAQVLMRANDPIYEIGLRFGGHRQEDRFWKHTLRALAAHFGVEAPVVSQMECLDPRRQWRQAGNIWQNAAVRTTLYTLTSPARWMRRRGQA
ncbi:MAG: hypothetical protein ACRDHP_05075 [Ktedonobacterales bacterium]